MSLEGVRQELADALSTVTGVTGYIKPPTALKPGDAWPRLGTLERGPGAAFLVTWRVLIILPVDEQVALNTIESLVPELFDALNPVGFIQTIEPITYEASSFSSPALQVTLIRE